MCQHIFKSWKQLSSMSMSEKVALKYRNLNISGLVLEIPYSSSEFL